MANRHKFFLDVHNYFGPLNQKQVDGFNGILDEWDRRAKVDADKAGQNLKASDYAVGTPQGAMPIPSVGVADTPTSVVQKGQMGDPNIQAGESTDTGAAKGAGPLAGGGGSAGTVGAPVNADAKGANASGSDQNNQNNQGSANTPQRYRLDGLSNDGTPPDNRVLAYILATVWHETMTTMQPIKEQGSEAYLKSQKYYPWYGRGLVQITWEDNYKKFGLKNPDDALDPKKSMDILFRGMLLGMFRGAKVTDSFGPHINDPMGARNVVNAGGDKASLIAGYYYQFAKALS